MLRNLRNRELAFFDQSNVAPFVIVRNALAKKFGLAVTHLASPLNCAKLFQAYTWYTNELEIAFRAKSERDWSKMSDDHYVCFKKDKNIGLGQVEKNLYAIIFKNTNSGLSFEDLNSLFARTHHFNQPTHKHTLRRRLAESQPLYELTLAGDDQGLKDLLRLYGTRAKAKCLEERSRLNRNLLHAACISGSEGCLRLILNTLGSDASQLYTKDDEGFTPGQHAIQKNAQLCLEKVFHLSPFNPVDELLHNPHPNYRPMIEFAAQNDINLLLFIVKQFDEKTLKAFCDKSNTLINTILTSHTGAGFLVLKDYIDEKKLLEEIAKSASIPFTTQCMIENFMRAIEKRKEFTPKI